ncbi:MAG TPA: sigma-E factor regulatory protein RseB domain-containing protein [Armatimonadota bacterium]
MTRRGFLLLVPLALIGIQPPAHCANAESILRRTYKADRLYSYVGRQEATLSLWGSPTKFQLMFLHQRPNRDMQWPIRPDDNRDHPAGPGPGPGRFMPRGPQGRRLPAEERLSLLLRNYRLKREGTGQVAGRKATVLSISPRRPGNPSQTLWIDDDTGIVLRNQLRNCFGAMVSDTAFVKLDLNPGPANKLPFPDPPKRPEPGFLLLRPTYVPTGYQYVATEGIEIRGQQAAHLMYTDGLNTISLFQRIRKDEPPVDDPHRDGPRRDPHPGPLPPWARRGDPHKAPIQIVKRHLEDRSVTLIGDIPRPELEKMAGSLR